MSGEIGRRPGVCSNVVHGDQSPVRKLCADGVAEILYGLFTSPACDVGGPVTGQSPDPGVQVEFAKADTANTQTLAKGTVSLGHDGVGVGQLAQGIAEREQEPLALGLTIESDDSFTGLGDVERHPDVPLERALTVEARIDRDPHPAPLAIVTLEPGFEAIGPARRSGLALDLMEPCDVVGMHGLEPDVAGDVRCRAAIEGGQGCVDELDLALGIGQPYGGGRGVGHQPEAFLALAQRRLGAFGLGDIDDDGDEALGLAIGPQQTLKACQRPDGRAVGAEIALFDLARATGQRRG